MKNKYFDLINKGPCTSWVEQGAAPYQAQLRPEGGVKRYFIIVFIENVTV